MRARFVHLTTALSRALPAAIAVAVISVLGVAGYHGYGFITSSERFAVKVVDIRGNRTISDERISTILDVHEGENIFRVELETLEARLASEPTIARASVSRRLPDTLLVDIEEYQPAALIDLDGLYLVDATGHVYKRAMIAQGDGAGLPVITGLDRQAYVDSKEVVQEQIRRALTAVALYRDSATAERPALGEINMHPRHGITFSTYERAISVRVGQVNETELRANLRAFDDAWHALTESERKRARIVYADTRNRPDRVTVGFDHRN